MPTILTPSPPVLLAGMLGLDPSGYTQSEVWVGELQIADSGAAELNGAGWSRVLNYTISDMDADAVAALRTVLRTGTFALRDVDNVSYASVVVDPSSISISLSYFGQGSPRPIPYFEMQFTVRTAATL